MTTGKRSWLGALFSITLLLGACAPEAITPQDAAPYATVQPGESREGEAEPSTDDQALPELGCTPGFAELPDILYIPAKEYEPGVELLDSADFNGDGFADVIVTRIVWQADIGSPIDILVNDGKGRFSVETESLFPDGIPAVYHPAKIILEDFNRDGITDAFIADSGMDAPPFPGIKNTLLLSQSNGTFRDASDHLPDVVDQTHNAASADIDLDGDVDLFIANLGGEDVNYILLNDGSGVFSTSDEGLVASVAELHIDWYTAAAFGDVDDDGYPDLILGQGNPNRPSHIVLNNRSGQFDAQEIELPGTPLGSLDLALDIDVLDINHDQLVDLVMIYTLNDYSDRYIQILINLGNAQFEDRTEDHIAQPPYKNWLRFLNPADLNSDGAVDFLLGVNARSSIAYLNDGAGWFTLTDLGFDLFEYAVADFDNDGWMDLMNSAPANGTAPEFHSTFINIGCR